MKGSIIIVTVFIIGIVFGRTGLVPESLDIENISYYVLCVLMVLIGFTIGSDTEIARKFRTLNPRLALLPVVSIAGAFAGCLIVALCSGRHTIAEWMALGSGFGCYSLSGVLISEYKGIELGTIALLTNIVREIITLLGAPLLLRIFGPLAPIAAGGATSMDTTLPIITKTCGKKYVPVTMYNGLLSDFTVPFFISLFCSL